MFKSVLRQLICLIFLSGISLEAFADQVHAPEVLNLKAYIALVQENDPAYQQLEINKKRIDFTVDAGISGNEYQLDAESQYGYGDDDVDTKSLTAKVSKEILETGTRLSISHSSAKNTDRNEKISELQVEQDLLKNAFGKERALQKKILSKTEQLERLEALDAYEDYLSGKISLYLDFSQAAMEVELTQSLLNSAKDLYQYIDDKYRKSAANSTDLKLARLQVILKEEQLLLNKEKLDSIRQVILTSLNLDDESIYPEFFLNLVEMIPRENKTFNVQQYREYQSLVLKNAIIADEYKVVQDEDAAELSLLGAYKIDDSTRFTTSVNRKESSLGLRLSMPFKNTKASAQKKIKALDIKYGELDEVKLSKELQGKYKSLEMRLEKSKRQYDLSNEKLTLMKEILEEENLRYRRGRIDTDKIIEDNNTYALYQFDKSAQLLALNKNYLDWLALNDLLINIE